MKMFSVFDRKVAAYTFPFTARSYGEAERMIENTRRDPTTSLGMNPSDYVVYFLGEFNEDDGTFSEKKEILVDLAHASLQEVAKS